MTGISDVFGKTFGSDSEGNNGNDNGNGNGNGGSNARINGNGDDKSKGPKPVAERLVELVTQNSNTFFKDQYGAAYANIKTTDHHEIVRVESNKFKRHLIRLYYEDENKVANAEAVSNAVQVLYAKAEYKGDTMPLSLRVALHNDDFYYDLTNERWQSVRITKGSWCIIDETPTPLFDRYSHHIAQAYPSTEYEPDVFDRFMDLVGVKKENDRILLKVYIITLFIPNIQHVILQVYGEQGGAKSMLETLIKELVDPAKPKLLSVHRDRMEFIQQLAQNHLVFYDNLKYIPNWLSDEACRAVTGSGSSKRKLYTDDDAIVYEYKRCPGFNGINLVLTEPDALDRSIIIERERIKEENMIEETKILQAFYEIRPKLLGYIFDILSKTIQIKPTVKLTRFSRMGDFTIWGEAIARAMGYRELEFIEAYSDNRGKQNIEAIENNALGQAIARFLSAWYYEKEPEEDGERSKCWFGTTSAFLEKLNIMALEHNINTGSKSWPKAANSLTKRLKAIQSNIREGLGFDVSIARITTGKHKGVSSVKVWKLPSPSSPSSPHQNQAQNQDQNSEDTSSGEDTNPHQADESSPENEENRAQNEASEGSEGSEDTFRTLTGAGTIYRLGNSDTFACHHCGQRGDKWFMNQHQCNRGPNS